MIERAMPEIAGLHEIRWDSNWCHNLKDALNTMKFHYVIALCSKYYLDKCSKGYSGKYQRGLEISSYSWSMHILIQQAWLIGVRWIYVLVIKIGNRILLYWWGSRMTIFMTIFGIIFLLNWRVDFVWELLIWNVWLLCIWIAWV